MIRGMHILRRFRDLHMLRGAEYRDFPLANNLFGQKKARSEAQIIKHNWALRVPKRDRMPMPGSQSHIRKRHASVTSNKTQARPWG